MFWRNLVHSMGKMQMIGNLYELMEYFVASGGTLKRLVKVMGEQGNQ